MPLSPPHGDSADGDFLDQFLVVGVQRIQAVDFVVLCFVCCGVAQDHQRVELGQRFNRLPSLHLLRLIQNQDRSVRLDHIDRLPRLKIIQLFINPPGVLPGRVERLHVDDHHVDAGLG